MSSLSRLAITRLLFSTVAVSLAGLVGCSQPTNAPITAASSKYQAADESGTKTETTPALKPSSDPTKSLTTPSKEPPTNTKSAVIKPPLEPAEGDNGENPYPVPEGDVKTLLSFMAQLSRRKPAGASKQEQIEDFVAQQQARISAGQKVLAQKCEKQEKEEALQHMQSAYQGMVQLEIPGAIEALHDFYTALSKDADPDLAKVGKLQIWGLHVGEIMAAQPKDGKEIVAEVKKLLEMAGDDPDTFTAANEIAQLLEQQFKFHEDAAEVLELAGKQFLDHKEPKIAKAAASILQQAKILRSNVMGLASNVLRGTPDAEPKLLAALEKLFADPNPSGLLLSMMQQPLGIFEQLGKTKLNEQILAILEKSYANHSDPATIEKVTKLVANAKKRAGLVGNPLVVEGALVDGSPFDFAQFAGKIVLVDFWATWCKPCLEELPNIAQNYQQYHDQGFEVVGVNLDGNLENVKRFTKLQKLPWPTVIATEVATGKNENEDFEHHPTAALCGVEAIPFVVLIGRDGKVDSIHVRGEQLGKRLNELIPDPTTPEGDPKTEPPAKKPADKAEGDTPAAEPGVEKNIELPAAKAEETTAPPAKSPAPTEPPAKEPSADQKVQVWLRGWPQFVHSLQTPPVSVGHFSFCAAPDQPPTEKAEEKLPNPYLAKPDLSPEKLVAYLQKMEDKPKAIQARPEFAPAIVEACDRLLTADPPVSPPHFLLAAETKLAVLHKQASLGNADADAQLEAFVTKLNGEQPAPLAKKLAFLQLERKVLKANDLPLDQLPPFLTELAETLKKEQLGRDYLRLASSTVTLINKIEDGDKREEYFEQFGNLFATSSDKKLSKYGKKLAQKPESSQSDLVGKPLELAGTTTTGEELALSSLKGKVVLVDFWATWCGPCRQAMPKVKDLYEAEHAAGLEVLGISLDEDQDALKEYIEEQQLAWKTLCGEGTQALATKCGVRGIPTMILIDREGKVVAVSHQVDELIPQLKELLKPKG